MGTVPIPRGATIDDPTEAPSGAVPIPKGATVDAAEAPSDTAQTPPPTGQPTQGDAISSTLADMIGTGTQALAPSIPAVKGPGQTLEKAVRQGTTGFDPVGKLIDLQPQDARSLTQAAGEHLSRGEYLKAAGSLIGALGVGVASEDPMYRLVHKLVDAGIERAKREPAQAPTQAPSAPTTEPATPPRADAKAGPYATQLSPGDEQQFQNWVKQNKIPWQDSPTADYDMRGFWKAMTSGDPEAQRNAQTGHFPDTFKTPYHASFSNESQYATPNAPHWEGQQLIKGTGKQKQVVFDETVEPVIQGAAEKYDVDAGLLRRIVTQESNFNPRAVSPKGAMGYMQLMPDTAKGLSDPFDPQANIDRGAQYFRSLLDRYKGDQSLALAAYNAGPGAVDRAGGIPRIKETQDYVNAITSAAPKLPTPAQAQADPPPGYMVEPSREEFASLPAELGEIQKAGQYLAPAARIVGGMASSAMRASMPYIAMQIYKKATGQPNKLDEIPENAVKTFGLLLSAGPEEAGAEEAAAGKGAKAPVVSISKKGLDRASQIHDVATAQSETEPEEPEATGEPVKGALPERFKPIKPGERTAVRAERTGGPMRLVERDGKWFDAKSGEEYQWKERRRI